MESIEAPPSPAKMLETDGSTVAESVGQNPTVAHVADSENTDDNNNDQRDAQDDVTESHPVVVVGGKVDKMAFALLAGIFIDPKDDKNRTTLSVPLTRIPAILGRSHETSDKSFFGLGKHKSLSREQARIFYTEPHGGTLGQHDADSDELTYRPPSGLTKKKPSETVIRMEGEALPAVGFFAIKNSGKNRIVVDRRPVHQNEVALLKNGSTIRMSSYYLHFLLPMEATSKTVRVPNPDYKKRTNEEAPAGQDTPNNKKAKLLNATKSRLQSATPEQLLDAMSEGILIDDWNPLIGTELTIRAVRTVAKDEELVKRAQVEDGVSRPDIIEWLRTDNFYKRWIDIMLSKMEPSSFDTKLVRALLHEGFTRVGQGKKTKWRFPSSKDDGDDDDEEEDLSDKKMSSNVPIEKGEGESEEGSEADEVEEESEEEEDEPNEVEEESEGQSEPDTAHGGDDEMTGDHLERFSAHYTDIHPTTYPCDYSSS